MKAASWQARAVECSADALRCLMANQAKLAPEQLPALQLSSTKQLGRGLSSTSSCSRSSCAAARARQLSERCFAVGALRCRSASLSELR